MKQLTSLLKAIMSQDMNLFKYRAKSNSSKTKKQMFPVILALIFMYAIRNIFIYFRIRTRKIKFNIHNAHICNACTNHIYCNRRNI